MSKKSKYYVVKEKALPEVLVKVVQAKKMLDSRPGSTVQEVIDEVGLSRSSFYKYKDDIVPFHDETKGKTFTIMLQTEDKPGVLSVLLGIIAEFHGNILTIHQTIPINGVATLTMSVELSPDVSDADELIHELEEQDGVHYLKILGRE